jgi:hypothetical protein
LPDRTRQALPDVGPIARIGQERESESELRGNAVGLLVIGARERVCGFGRPGASLQHASHLAVTCQADIVKLNAYAPDIFSAYHCGPWGTGRIGVLVLPRLWPSETMWLVTLPDWRFLQKVGVGASRQVEFTRAQVIYSIIGLGFALGGLKSLITGQLSVFERGKLRLLHHFAGWQARVLAVVLILFGLVGLPLIGAPTWWWP